MPSRAIRPHDASRTAGDGDTEGRAANAAIETRALAAPPANAALSDLVRALARQAARRDFATGLKAKAGAPDHAAN
jgi:hypothetical protein